MAGTILTFKAASFKKLDNPFQLSDTSKKPDTSFPQMYFAICDVKDIPDDIPMATNPRGQSLKNGVGKKIISSLLNTGEPNFYLLNRGLVISAADLQHNEESGELSVLFTDSEVHGDIDGGHTYRAILEKRGQLDPGQQYVKLEILTGVEDFFQSLASARNTSNPVDDKSIAELENRFDIIKIAISGEPFADEVYFRENDKGAVDVTDIVSLLTMFNIDKYPDTSTVPYTAYSGKKKCVDYYIDTHKACGDRLGNPFVRMAPIMPDIFKLYDKLEVEIGNYYRDRNSSGRFGAVKGVSVPKGDDKFASKFYGSEMEYQTSAGLLYPIIGAFRALVQDDGVSYSWKADPFKVLDKLGPELVEMTVARNRTLGNNPQAVGKDAGHWKALYLVVALDAMSGGVK